MQGPIITYRYVPYSVKVASIAVFGMLMVAVGFVVGIWASMQPVPVGPTIQFSIPLPEAHPYAPGTFGEPVVYSASRWQYTDISKEIKCLADNIYFEGRNQGVPGQIAIGLATLNRVESKYYPNSICDVVWQQATDKRSGKLTAQFSWTLDGKSDRIKNKKAYEPILRLAEGMIAEGTLDNFEDFTEGATHYHADYVNPYWAKPNGELQMVAYVGDHKFYK